MSDYSKEVQPCTQLSDSSLRKFYHDRNKASAIICPYQKCSEYCVETEEMTLVQNFSKHLQDAHNLTPSEECVLNLGNIISYIRNNKKIPYADPFLHVDYENLLQYVESEQ